jgi:formylglycine-generating enzyme required for sulfatase activity
MHRQTIILTLSCLIALSACGPAEKEAEKAPAKKEAKADAPAKKAEAPEPSHKIEARGSDAREMAHVPAGAFIRGSKPGVGTDEERPQKTITLKGFWIDKLEVSVADWEKCMKNGPCGNDKFYRKYKIKKKRPEPCNYGQPDRGRHPINCVSWHGARAYCKWAGKRLPTEAEWEKAARGKDGKLYPWGSDKASCARACMVEKSMFGCGTRTSCPVGERGYLGESPYGAMDMAGNVYEWVADSYTRTYFQEAPTENPVNRARSNQRPVRGGAYSSDEAGVRAAKRSGFDAVDRISFVGFRCAMDE